MARAATTTDAFNAVAEPQRRRILTLLKGRERSVNDLAGALRIPQPRVSKHLRVLRQVGLVSAREAGRQRLYRLYPGGSSRSMNGSVGSRSSGARASIDSMPT